MGMPPPPRHGAAWQTGPVAGAPIVATVNVLDVFTRVVEMQVQLATISQQLTDLPDHEARLRILERFRYTLAGIALVAGGLSGYIGYLVGRR